MSYIRWPHQAFDTYEEAQSYVMNQDLELYDVYDCTQIGYGNQGHTFADHLNHEQRNALLEYLKTL